VKGTDFVTSNTELQFVLLRPNKIRITDIQETVIEAWRRMGRPGTIEHANSLAYGLDRTDLPRRLADMVTLRPDGAGVGTVDLIVVLSGKVAWDLWKHVLLPHIRDVWGDDALKRKRASSAPKSKHRK
jgi:hypothetical protein